jgi:hypothetical protein
MAAIVRLWPWAGKLDFLKSSIDDYITFGGGCKMWGYLYLTPLPHLAVHAHLGRKG